MSTRTHGSTNVNAWKACYNFCFRNASNHSQVTQWYKYRAFEIERLSRQADFALELVKLGVERGVQVLQTSSWSKNFRITISFDKCHQNCRNTILMHCSYVYKWAGVQQNIKSCMQVKACSSLCPHPVKPVFSVLAVEQMRWVFGDN